MYIGLVIDDKFKLVKNTPPMSSLEDVLMLIDKGRYRLEEICEFNKLAYPLKYYVETIILSYRGKFHHDPSLISLLSSFYSFPQKTRLLYLLLLLIPKGRVVTYSGLAKILSMHPRGVGILLAKNPYPLIIPCHRVVRNNGSIGGYLGSVKYMHLKEEILIREGVKVNNHKVPLSEILPLDTLLGLHKKATDLLSRSASRFKYK